MRLVGYIDTLFIQVFMDYGADLNFLNPSVAIHPLLQKGLSLAVDNRQ